MRRAHVEFGYRAAYMPNMQAREPRRDRRASSRRWPTADVIIAEAGAWKNLITHDEATAPRPISTTPCTSWRWPTRWGPKPASPYHGTVGHAGDPWQLSDNYDYGPHPDNQSEAGFQRAVETARYVIDMVKPKRTKFSLEMVPWLVTDTPENYLKLLKAIDRPQFGAHIDAVNMIDLAAALFQQRPDDPRRLRAARAVGRLVPRQGHRDEGRAG